MNLVLAPLPDVALPGLGVALLLLVHRRLRCVESVLDFVDRRTWSMLGAQVCSVVEQNEEHAGMSYYEKVMDALSDGDWHSVDDLRTVSSFPEEWIKELRCDGLVDEDEDGRVLLRQREDRVLASA